MMVSPDIFGEILLFMCCRYSFVNDEILSNVVKNEKILGEHPGVW
jgi:hypothetical protein